jgi:signal transduction histidine kinase
MSVNAMKYGVALFMVTAMVCGSAFAQEKSPEELAAESEAKCEATASTPATPQQIVERVNAAAALVDAEGEAAFSKFKGTDSDFLYGGTYIWIHDEDGVMLMHPIKNKMEGKRLLNLKDRNGKLFFVEMNEVGKNEGAGWVDYVWPKPGEKEVSPKVSYIKKATMDGKTVFVCSGVYDLTMDDVQGVK